MLLSWYVGVSWETRQRHPAPVRPSFVSAASFFFCSLSYYCAINIFLRLNRFVCSCCRYLIGQGASVGVVNSEGETPLDIAEEEAMEELLQNEINRQGAVPHKHQ